MTKTTFIFKVYEKNKFRPLIIGSRFAYFGDEPKKGQMAFDFDTFIKLFEFLIDNIYVKFGDDVFRQVVGIPMGTNCAPLLANLYLFYYEYDFLEKLSGKHIHYAKSFNRTFRYIDDLLSINNKHFKDHVQNIYPSELELKETTESDSECSYLDLLFFSENGELKIRLYDKRDDFNFHIVNFPFMDSNIPISPAYGIYISRLIAFARICSDFTDFSNRHKLLVNRLLSQGVLHNKLRKSYLQFVDRYKELLSKYKVDLVSHINEILSET